MRHVISALVMNEPGVLANVAGMFAARGFNIDSLVVGRTEKPELAGTETKLESFIELIRPYGITELARTGVIAMARGMQLGKDSGAAGAKRRTRSLDAPAAAALPPS